MQKWPLHIDTNKPDDLFLRDAAGHDYAGTHLLIDCWNAKYLDNLERIEAALRDAVTVAGATLLHIHLHHFSPNGGVSGVAVLAESHITIHTWPERDYAALDVFMCGDTQPLKTVDVFSKVFATDEIQVSEHHRGKTYPITVDQVAAR